MADAALERLVNVVTLLAAHPEPLEREEIVRLVPGFPSGEAAAAKAFERVKETARSLGIGIEAVTLPGRSRVGYRLGERSPRVALSQAEARALEGVLGVVRVAGTEEGLARIGLALGAPPAPQRRSLLLEMPPALAEALAQREAVELGYRDRRRRVVPVGVVARWGHAYLVGIEAGTAKTFRLDRLEGEVRRLGPAGEVRVGDLGGVLAEHPRELFDEEPTEVRLAGPSERLAAVGADPASGVLRARNLDVVVADVILHDLVVLGPESVRRALLERLAAARRALDREPAPLGRLPRPRRANLAERYRMLQTMLGALRERGRAPLGELASLAGATREEAAELLETASMCGLPPYSPDVLLEVLVDDPGGEVEASLARTPPRGALAVADAIAVAATLEAFAETTGGQVPEALRGLRERLRAELGVLPSLRAPEAVRLVLPLIHRAIELGACLRFAYAPIGAPSGQRLVRPRELHASDGVWYLEATSPDGRTRTFRVERMSEVALEEGCDLAEGDRSGTRSAVVAVLGVPMDGRGSLEYLLGGQLEEVEPGEVLLRAYFLGWAARVVVALAAEVRRGPEELREAARAVVGAAEERHGVLR